MNKKKIIIVSLVLLVVLTFSLSCEIVEKVEVLLAGEVAASDSGPVPAGTPTIGDTIQDGSIEVTLHRARFGGLDRPWVYAEVTIKNIGESELTIGNPALNWPGLPPVNWKEPEPGVSFDPQFSHAPRKSSTRELSFYLGVKGSNGVFTNKFNEDWPRNVWFTLNIEGRTTEGPISVEFTLPTLDNLPRKYELPSISERARTLSCCSVTSVSDKHHFPLSSCNRFLQSRNSLIFGV